MSLEINIPKIAITPEYEDGDDDDNNLLNLAEALTDVEELFEDQISSRRNSFRKKLKIKVIDNDGYNTALEDVEASDEDDFKPSLVQHNRPISLEDIDMEHYSTEEKYGISQKQFNNFEYLKLQSSNSNEKLLRKTIELLDSLPSTDVENYDTENESDYDINVPDSEVYVDNSDAMQIIIITDDTQDGNRTQLEQNFLECGTPLTPTVFPSSISEEKVFKPSKRPPTFTQMMRCKGNSGQSKMRKKKRNKIHSRKFNGQRETSEIQSSDKEFAKPGSIKFNLTQNSLNYESDVEEENKLQFPVCKKTFTKNKHHLRMPEFDINIKTDEEDFECETDAFGRRISTDSTIFQNQLDEMASCYSFTKDKHEVLQTKVEGKQKIKYFHMDADTKTSRDHEEVKIDQDTKKLLKSPSIQEGEVTDIENISDSKEHEDNKIDSNNEVVNSGNETEEETFKGSLNDINIFPDIMLPPPTRTLIIAEENRSLIPTVHILSLGDKEDSFSDFEGVSTEDESMNSDTELFMRGRRVLNSPQLPIIEGENVKMSENSINPLHNKSAIYDVATDIEDLDEENIKVKKRFGIKMFLSPHKSSAGSLTDLEDIEISDCQSDGRLVVRSEVEGQTDLEYLDSSDEDSFARTELQGNTKLSMKLNFPTIIPQGFTDTEELVASTDDEINYSKGEMTIPINKELDGFCSLHGDIESHSNIDYLAPTEVMYLKGGGFQEILGATERFLDDADPHYQDVMDAWVYFNQSDKINTSLQKGETSQLVEPSDSTISKGSQDSRTEKEDGMSRQQPIDQHQLSSEMKELLKVMEEASKK